MAGSPVSKSLDSVGLLGAEYVELFGTFNDGMEWTENEYLRAWYRSQKMEVSSVGATALRMALFVSSVSQITDRIFYCSGPQST